MAQINRRRLVLCLMFLAFFGALSFWDVLVNRRNPVSNLSDVQQESSGLQVTDRNAAIKAHINAVALDPLFDWKQPIHFKGRVADQYSTPVPGANVVLSWNNLSPGGTQSRYVVSDRLGEFELVGESGKSLSVAVSKNGYFQVTESVQGFEFADPAAFNYVRIQDKSLREFRLIKFNTEARVLKYRLDTVLDSRRAIRFDPIRLRFDTPQSAVFELRSDSSQVWSLVVSSIGGVLETDSEFPILAPVEGYAHKLTVADRIDFSINKFGLSSVFYFRQGSRPLFGAVKVKLETRSRFAGSDGLDALIGIEVYVNPDGGLDLGMDPSVSGVKLQEDDLRNGFGPVGLEGD